MAKEKPAHRFGGRATASGVGYEGHLAAWLGIKMLHGQRSLVWKGIHGGNIAAITLQTPTAVDDVVVDLTGVAGVKAVHISAKDRAKTIALTKASDAFTDPMRAFVTQCHATGGKTRLVWAVPTSAGTKVNRHLLNALESFRRDAGDQPLQKFINGRIKDEAEALRAVLKIVKPAWMKATGAKATDAQLKGFLRAMFVEVMDFEHGKAHDQAAEAEVRAQLAANPDDSGKIWRKVDSLFTDANRRGLRVTADSLRRDLKAEGLQLLAPPDYAEDLRLVREITNRSNARLEEHCSLPFGPTAIDQVMIDRPVELAALLGGVKRGHLLVTGEPGGGKSGLLHALVEALRAEGTPCVTLLAEEVYSPSLRNVGNLQHPLDEVLANWPDGVRGVVITDALDAVRDVDTQKRVRSLLQTIQRSASGWTVVASVREFDLKNGRELREAFPGEGVAGFSESDFKGVAHFHVPRFSEVQVDALVSLRPEIGQFVASARANPKSATLHRSPFYLRLAATLLKNYVPPQRLADWTSPAVLLREFWRDRVQNGEGANARHRVLRRICEAMVARRSIEVSEKELVLNDDEAQAISDLRSRGILQGPNLQFATLVNTDQLSFVHHLLHDYAIARAYIPEAAEPFVTFVVKNPLLPVLYRQSFVFALEELWDADSAHATFWSVTLRLESEPTLHAISRLLAPNLAARRVRTSADLDGLRAAITGAKAADEPGPKALIHLTSGLQDAAPSIILDGAEAWCEFVEQLSGLLVRSAFLEWPLAQLVARIREAGCGSTANQAKALNVAGRNLLAMHVAKPVEKGWVHASRVGVAAISATFASAPVESEAALLSLLTPARLANFPQADLDALIDNLDALPPAGGEVIRRVYAAAFADRPAPGRWRNMGPLTLPMSVQTSDDWNQLHYRLSLHYQKNGDADAALLTEAAYHAWSSVTRKKAHGPKPEPVVATVTFRGKVCTLTADHSHISNRHFEHHEDQILHWFEQFLRKWASASDPAQLNAALDRFATLNPPPLMWTILMEAGKEHPATLGLLLVDLLDEPAFLTHYDLFYAAADLLGALHYHGDSAMRARLEKIVLVLPQRAPIDPGETRSPLPEWLEAAQDRALAHLEEANLIVPEVLILWQARSAAGALKTADHRGFDFRTRSHEFSPRELIERGGVDLKRGPNEEMFKLQQRLEGLIPTDKAPFDGKLFAKSWSLLLSADAAVRQHRKAEPMMAASLWGTLAMLCEQLTFHAKWVKGDSRWVFIRKILLRAARDARPKRADNDSNQEGPSYGSPAPRVEAAQGLPNLVYHLKRADAQVTHELKRLAKDFSKSVRWNVALRLAVLETSAPVLMWKLFDRIIRSETRYAVMESLVSSLSRLWPRHPEEVLMRLASLAQKAARAPANHNVHDALAAAHFYESLRTGRKESGAYIQNLVRHVNRPAAGNALSRLLAACRSDRLFIHGILEIPSVRDDELRAKVWDFANRVLDAAQAKIAPLRAQIAKFDAANTPKSAETDKVLEAVKQLSLVIHEVAQELYFACGATAKEDGRGGDLLSDSQTMRFWQEARPLLTKLADEMHPQSSSYLIKTLHHLLPCNPGEVFLLVAKSLRSSRVAGIQYDQLIAGEVVALVNQALADHRDIFRSVPGQKNPCLDALLEVLDQFVEAGWPEARKLTHRLEEIHR
jgi:hypothetical protein